MTRETKIGLLVGLGFIVVFAVLLSHTGTVPPPGENIAQNLVQKPQPANPVLSGDMRTEIGRREPVPPTVDTPRVPGSSPEAEPSHAPMEDRVVRLDSLPDLPAPHLLDPSAPLAMANGDDKRGELEAARPVFILSHRTAPALPEVVEPTPNVPHDPPPQSPTPDQPKALAVSTGGKLAPTVSPPKEYVVQSKDSLAKIARKEYQNSDPRVIEFLVKSNEGRIKNANSIVEGQKLLIPDLPREMFDVQLASGRALSMEEVLNDAKRKAPAAGPSNVAPGAGTTNTKPDPKAKPDPKSKIDAKAKPDNKVKSDTKPEPKAQPKPELKADLNLVPESNLKFTPAESEASKPAIKLDENSAPRLSLSGLVPVRPATTAAPKETRGNRDSTPAKPAEAKPKKSDKAERDSKDAKADAGKGDQLYRVYEVKANDTLGTIARKELGASEHWQEIKKLNGGIDPQKMKPGDRIKLPRKPVSVSSPRERASA